VSCETAAPASGSPTDTATRSGIANSSPPADAELVADRQHRPGAHVDFEEIL